MYHLSYLTVIISASWLSPPKCLWYARDCARSARFSFSVSSHVVSVVMMAITTNFLQSSYYVLNTVLSPVQVFSLHSNPFEIGRIPLFYRWGNWIWELINNVPEFVLWSNTGIRNSSLPWRLIFLKWMWSFYVIFNTLPRNAFSFLVTLYCSTNTVIGKRNTIIFQPETIQWDQESLMVTFER